MNNLYILLGIFGICVVIAVICAVFENTVDDIISHDTKHIWKGWPR